MHFFLGGVGSPFNDQNAADVASYINSLFGEESVLPKSPVEMPKYKELVRTFDDDAMKIVYVEYELPGPSRMPWSAFPDKDGNYWMPYYGDANKIGRLDPKTGEVQEYPVPNHGTAAIHSAVPSPDGSVWLTEQGSNKLGHWDPATRTITEYQDSYIRGQRRNCRGRIEAHAAHRRAGKNLGDGRPAHRFRSEDERVHADQGNSLRLRPRARQGRELLVCGICAQRKDRQGGRQDAESDQVAARPRPTRGLGAFRSTPTGPSGSRNFKRARSGISIPRLKPSRNTRCPDRKRLPMRWRSGGITRCGIPPSIST